MNTNKPDYEKQFLKDLVIANGSYNGLTADELEQFSSSELEGILEYGDPKAFWENKYSDERSFYYNKYGNSLQPHQPLLNKYAKIQEDLTLASKLGGHAMKNRIKKTLKSDDHIFDAKRKIVLTLLDTLPEKFRNIKQFIKENDLISFTNFCKPYYKPKIVKYLITLVEDRCKTLGLYINSSELLNYYNIKRKSLMKFRFELKDAGFFNINTEDDLIETINNAAYNILFNLCEKKIITKRIQMMAQSNVVSFAQKYPLAFRGREEMGSVVAFLSIRLASPQIKLKDLCQSIDKSNEKLIIQTYQASKRAEQRSTIYLNEISKIGSIEK